MKNQSVHLRRSVMCALYAALLAVSAWIQIPAAIPFTLQTAAVCIAAALSGGAAAMAVTLYLSLGAIGLPVFSNFNSGWAALIGPTAGYLWGLFLIVLTVSVGKRHEIREGGKNLVSALLCLVGRKIGFHRGIQMQIGTMDQLHFVSFLPTSY